MVCCGRAQLNCQLKQLWCHQGYTVLWGKTTPQQGEWRRSLVALRNAVVFPKNPAYQSFSDLLKVSSGRNLMVSYYLKRHFHTLQNHEPEELGMVRAVYESSSLRPDFTTRCFCIPDLTQSSSSSKSWRARGQSVTY